MPFGIHPEDRDEIKLPFQMPIDKTNEALLQAQAELFESTPLPENTQKRLRTTKQKLGENLEKR
jgi:hypothetical protein